MAYTAASIITGALKFIGVGRAENLDPINDIINNLPILNQIIAKLTVKGTLIQATIDEGFLLTAGTRVYTIGSGQTPGPSVFNTSRPWRIESAYIVDSQQGHYPVEIITREQFNTIIDQELSESRPTTLFYDIGSAEQTPLEIGTITLYYIPDPNDTYTLHLNQVKMLTGFVNTTDAFNFDISYADYMMFAMGLRIAPSYGITITQDMKDQMRESENILEMQNWRKPSLTKRRPSGGGNILDPYTGQVTN
jgi:hypothetical protein